MKIVDIERISDENLVYHCRHEVGTNLDTLLQEVSRRLAVGQPTTGAGRSRACSGLAEVEPATPGRSRDELADEIFIAMIREDVEIMPGAPDHPAAHLARRAYWLADAMIAERKRDPEPSA